MSIFFGIFLIVIGMYILYILSSKQIGKTQKTFLKPLTKHLPFMRFLAFILFFLAGSCFINAYGSSIGFVSWWLFATPTVFFLILYINDLKSKSSKKPPKTSY